VRIRLCDVLAAASTGQSQVAAAADGGDMENYLRAQGMGEEAIRNVRSQY